MRGNLYLKHYIFVRLFAKHVKPEITVLFISKWLLTTVHQYWCILAGTWEFLLN